MKDTALHPAAADYRVEVARVLADLPPGEAEEILDDVELNLSEVVAELGDTVTSDLLRARLGTPQEYAAELRAAAGYPPLRSGGSLGGGRFGAAELVLAGLVTAAAAALVGGIGVGREQVWWFAPCLLALAVEAVNALWLRGREPGLPDIAALSITRSVRDLGDSLRIGRWAETVRFVTGLRSAWWVARAAVVGVSVGVLGGGAWWGVVASVAALAGSLWLGSRPTRDRRLLWAAIPVNLFVVGLGIGVVSSGQLTRDDHYIFQDNGSAGPVGYSPGYGGRGEPGSPDDLLLGSLNGRRIENVYPFDSQGRPLKDVLLFDQDGKQLGLAPATNDHSCTRFDQSPPQPLVTNRERLPFPQPRVVRNPNTGECRIETGVPFTIAIPVQPGQPASTPQPPGAGQQNVQTPQTLQPSTPAALPSTPAGQPTSPTTAPVSPHGEAPPTAGNDASGQGQPNGQATAPPAGTPGAPNGS